MASLMFIVLALSALQPGAFLRVEDGGPGKNQPQVSWNAPKTGSSRQRYDGWYNNMANPSWGAIGSSVVFNVPPAYGDLTYQPSGFDRPNARDISNGVFSGPSGLPSYTNKTLLFVLFGQMVAYEMVHAADAACPVELLKVEVSSDDPDFGHNSSTSNSMPFVRSGYDKRTGQSPNNPRRPVNSVTSWVDGNFIYGQSEVWANCLRAFTGGRLLTTNTSRDFPALNKIGLPLDNFPDPKDHKLANPTDFWMFGDKHTHQNPGLTSLALVWFRYHNHVAKRLLQLHPDLREEHIYRKARRIVIATMQNIIYYEWLPELMSEPTPEYQGYNRHVHPGISATFEAAAFRFGHTMVPPGFYLRDSKCRFRRPGEKLGLRMCNTYWMSQSILQRYSVEEVLMGMISQIAEREDNIMVSDLRGKSYGPLHFSRHDLAVTTLMRGRDHGLPDYNTARKALGLNPVTTWEDINPWLYRNNKKEIFRLKRTYKDLDKLDIFPAGLMEFTPKGPGPLFRQVFKDQFLRIREADRFWFENKLNGLFTPQEIEDIRAIKFRDVILAGTDIRADSIQENVFRWQDGDPCPQPKQMVEEDLDPCTPHQGYDYFTGSEIPYITAFTSLGVFPFVCILVAYAIYKTKQMIFVYRARTSVKDGEESAGKAPPSPQPEPEPAARRSSFNDDSSSGRSNSSQSCTLAAWEWTGKTAAQRQVDLVLDDDRCTLALRSSDKGALLRTINFLRMDTVTWYTNNDNRRNLIFISIPKEYDLVLRFRTEQERSRFTTKFASMLEGSEKELLRYECRERFIYDKAITKSKRQELLSQFFRNVFAEAYNIKEIGPMDDFAFGQCKDIEECELSREEFAEALALGSDSLFVSQMFSVIDREQKGFISFRDMIYAVVVFSKGTCEDKLHLLFRMYDIDKSGTLDREEISKMIRSMVEIAGTTPSREEIDKIADRIFASAGIDGRASMKFEDFKTAFSEHNDLLQKVCLDWKGTRCGEKEAKQKGDRRASVDKRSSTDRRYSLPSGPAPVAERRASLFSKRHSVFERRPPLTQDMFTTPTKEQLTSSLKSSTRKKSISEGLMIKSMSFDVRPEVYSRLGAVLKDARHFMENHRQHIVYVFLFFFACVLTFAERFYTYAVDLEHKGFRSIAGYGVSLTRGAAASISLCFALLLLTMCRNLITTLRETVLNLYIPFDSMISFHKLVAWTALVFSAGHVLGYCFNFYHIATQPVQFLCIFNEIHFRSDILPTFSFWLFMNLTGVTGYLLVLVICVMYTFATQTSRSHIFNAFWITHKLFYVFYILVLLHGASRIIQDPMFWTYFMGPAILFTIDKTISLSRKKREIHIQDAELLPSGVTRVEFKRPPNFEYKSGQWVRIACLDLGKNEYHPFTLTSAPHEDTLCTHIRTCGPWTTALRGVLSGDNLRDKPLPLLYLDGPYGAGQQDWFRYDVSVLVGGGIGVTPYASILKDFVFMSSVKNTFRMKCRKVYFIWVTASQRHYEWFVDILRQVESVDAAELVETHIFITQFFQKFDLRTTMLYICEEHFQRMANKSIFTGLKARTHFGRPNFEDILVEVHNKHSKVPKVGVFSCGPPGLTKGVEKACHSASIKSKASFQHHFENF